MVGTRFHLLFVIVLVLFMVFFMEMDLAMFIGDGQIVSVTARVDRRKEDI